MDAGAATQTLREIIERSTQGVVAAYLFGSVARGSASSTSDVDVALLYDQPPPARLESLDLDLAAEMERVLRRPVDLVILNRAPCDLVHRVLRDGKLILETNRARRIQFEAESRRHYFDMQPFRSRYRRIAS